MRSSSRRCSSLVVRLFVVYYYYYYYYYFAVVCVVTLRQVASFSIINVRKTTTATTTTTTTDQGVVRQQLGYLPSNFVSVSARNRHGEPIAIQTYPLKAETTARQEQQRRPFPTLYWLTCPNIAKAIADYERQGYVSMIQETINQNDKMRHDFLQCHKEYAHDRWTSLSDRDQSWLLLQDNDDADDEKTPYDNGQFARLKTKQQKARLTSTQRMRWMLQSSGVAGTNVTMTTTSDDDDDVDDDDNDNNNKIAADTTPSIKCLHTHYAHYRSTMTTTGTTATEKRTENPVGAMVHKLLIARAENDPSLVL